MTITTIIIMPSKKSWQFEKNTIKTALGILIPGLIFLYLTPLIIKNFGIERFGFISILWILVGISNILDLGVSRALTRYVSDKRDIEAAKTKINNGSLWVIIILSFFWGLIIGYAFNLLIDLYQGSNTSIHILNELNLSRLYIIFTIPLVIVFSILRGILEGSEEFSVISQAKIAMGLAIALLLVTSQYFESTLVYVAITFALGRLLGTLILLRKTIKLFKPQIKSISLIETKEILIFGGWVSISNIASSFLVYFDRFALSYYAPPLVFGNYSILSETLSKVLFIPGALSTVLYPIMSKSNDYNKKIFLKKSYYYLISSLLVIFIPLCLWGQELFELWLGKPLESINSQLIILLMCIGFFINSLAHIPYTIIHGRGLSKITAKLHMMELVLFIPLILTLTYSFGIYGSIIAWLIRVSADFGLLHIISYKTK